MPNVGKGAPSTVEGKRQPACYVDAAQRGASAEDKRRNCHQASRRCCLDLGNKVLKALGMAPALPTNAFMRLGGPLVVRRCVEACPLQASLLCAVEAVSSDLVQLSLSLSLISPSSTSKIVETAFLERLLLFLPAGAQAGKPRTSFLGTVASLVASTSADKEASLSSSSSSLSPSKHAGGPTSSAARKTRSVSTSKVVTF